MTDTQPIRLAPHCRACKDLCIQQSVVMTEGKILEMTGLLKKPTPIPNPDPLWEGHVSIASVSDIVGTWACYMVGSFCSAMGHQRASQYGFRRRSSSK